jgi:hypothetical protein
VGATHLIVHERPWPTHRGQRLDNAGWTAKGGVQVRQEHGTVVRILGHGKAAKDLAVPEQGAAPARHQRLWRQWATQAKYRAKEA